MENPSNNSSNAVRRISSLEEHRAILKEVLQTAKRRVLIVSPFITNSALKSDGIPGKVRSATGRGVSVSVFTDHKLNREDDGKGAIKRSAQEGIAGLLRAGASVTVVNGIHNKTLARDEDLIADGSFNWLSAVRTKGGVHQREERTMIVEGNEAKAMIEKEVKGFEGKGQPVGFEKKTAKRLFRKIPIFILKSLLIAIFLLIGIGASWLLLNGHRAVAVPLIVISFAVFCWAISRMERGWFDDEYGYGYVGALYDYKRTETRYES